jgi:hypothetical protein
MPEHAATDNGGEIYLLGAAATVLLIGEDIDGQRQPTPRQHGHETLVAEGADETIEGHGGDMTDHGAQLQTQSTVQR